MICRRGKRTVSWETGLLEARYVSLSGPGDGRPRPWMEEFGSRAGAPPTRAGNIWEEEGLGRQHSGPRAKAGQ